MAGRTKQKKRTRPEKPLQLPKVADGVFRYHNGIETVCVDSFTVAAVIADSREFQQASERIDLAAQTKQPATLADMLLVIDILAPYFGFTPYKEENGARLSGMTKPECFAIVLRFMIWMEEVKKKLPV